MPRFYFNIYDGTEKPDGEGIELADLAHARAEAIRAAGEMIREMGDDLAGGQWQMRVADESGRTLLTLRFSAVESA
jgi:hypothetical protein